MIYETPEYLKICYENAKIILHTEGQVGSVNLSDILTFLIQNTGRFVERYASDLFIIWQNVETMVNQTKNRKGLPPEEAIIYFGLRKQGVDNNSYIMINLKETAVPVENDAFYIDYEKTYRKLFAIKITIDNNYMCHVMLREITKTYAATRKQLLIQS